MTDQERFYRIVESRKSIRSYRPEEPPWEVIQRILQAGFHAPSGKNLQNWRVFVVMGEKRNQYLDLSKKSWLSLKDQLAKRLKPSLYEFTERFFFTLGNAPVLMFFYSVNSPEEKYLTSVGGVYMAVQNINLAAVAEGLGCCTMGAPLEIASEVDTFLGVTSWPEYSRGEVQLLCGLTLGYPAHDPPKAPRQTEGRVFVLK